MISKCVLGSGQACLGLRERPQADLALLGQLGRASPRAILSQGESGRFEGKKSLAAQRASRTMNLWTTCDPTVCERALEALYQRYKDQGLVVLGSRERNA
jgi:hypothetical protein